MKIITVNTASLGEKIGLHPGDRLLKINGQRVQDEIDYKFRITDELVTLDFEINGHIKQVEVEKNYDVDLGVEFEEMKIRSCANDCVFCFVDQNPPNMRQGMYFRDGDYRMSYLHGHYITMTNMGQNDLDRIIEQRLTPLYVSVHVTEPELRQELFLYKRDDGLLEKLKYLTSNAIELHTQIVLMPSINDGDYLVKTLEDLFIFHPQLKTCTIVPVGLTKHRKGLMNLKTVDKDYAKMLLGQLTEMRLRFPGDQSPFVLFSDEWYILSSKTFPPLSDYGDTDLIENGVGQVRNFISKFEKESLHFPLKLKKTTNITIATGWLVKDIFHEKVLPILNKIENLCVNLIPIHNNFFGRSVTVTGLLTGKDIISQLSAQSIGDAIWMSHRILNDEGTRTLDDMTLDEISQKLGCPIVVSEDSFLDLFQEHF
jgi:putative radical SAM enzyme (TIGR03279 family)